MTQWQASEGKHSVSDDVDLAQVLGVLRRYTLWLVLVPLVLAALTFAFFQRIPPTFEASTSLMSSQPENSNSALSSSSITASQLPQGAVDEVVHSRASFTRIEELLGASGLPAEVQAKIKADLQKELATQKFSRIKVKARLDQLQRGVYDISAQAESPEASQFLATAAAKALLEWDLRRAQEGVSRAKRNIQQQLENVNQRLTATAPGSVDQQSLIAARGQLILNLSQAAAFEEGARGNLTLLAEANAPIDPVAPKPKRNAALVFLLSLFAGSGLALLLDSLRRTVRSTADLLPLGVAGVGELPNVARITRGQVVGLARTGEFYEPSGFMRVNLMSLVPHQPAIVGVTSARPGEGKSTVVATLATSLALTGKRVLIIDLDLHRPSQHEYWQVIGRPLVPLPGAQETAQTTVVQAVQEPYFASAVDVGEGVHFLPAGEAGRRTAAILGSPALAERLVQWSQAYDVVLLDTPPVLSMADAFVVGKHTDGLILVVESGATAMPELQRVLRDFQTTNTTLLGVIVNKVRRSQQGYYYSYHYSAPQKAAPQK